MPTTPNQLRSSASRVSCRTRKSWIRVFDIGALHDFWFGDDSLKGRRHMKPDVTIAAFKTLEISNHTEVCW